MRTFALLLIFIAAASSYGSSENPDFVCETTHSAKKYEVRYHHGSLSFDDGKLREVAVASVTNDEQFLKVSGLAKGVVFAGGGLQSVSVKIEKKLKSGTFSIFTKTFYRNEEESHRLTCSHLSL